MEIFCDPPEPVTDSPANANKENIPPAFSPTIARIKANKSRRRTPLKELTMKPSPSAAKATPPRAPILISDVS